MMGMAICHTCDGPIHDGHCPDFRLREKFDSLRAALQKAEAERIAERTTRIAKTEEVGTLTTHYESAIRALTLATDRAEKAEAMTRTWQIRAEAYKQAEVAAEKAAKKAESERNELLSTAYKVVIWEPGMAPSVVATLAKHGIERLEQERDSERARADRLEAKLSELTDGGEK